MCYCVLITMIVHNVFFKKKIIPVTSALADCYTHTGKFDKLTKDPIDATTFCVVSTVQILI